MGHLKFISGLKVYQKPKARTTILFAYIYLFEQTQVIDGPAFLLVFDFVIGKNFRVGYSLTVGAGYGLPRQSPFSHGIFDALKVEFVIRSDVDDTA
jgi:hypothetical protein